jgi:pimeloyl-ACP methyl ester carboxylesterase
MSRRRSATTQFDVRPMDRQGRRRRWSLLALGLIALVAIALALNALVTSAETKQAQSDTGRVVELPGEDLHVLDVGPRRAPPIVLIHGYTGSIRWWDGVIRRLAREHRVVAVDLLGHGSSDMPRDGYSIPHQARLVADALAARGVSRVTVVGHSMGGSVAVALAADHPEAVNKLLVLDMATGPPFRQGFVEQLSRTPVIGQLLRRIATDGTIRDGYRDAFAPGFRVPDRFVEDFRAMTYSAYTRAREGSVEFLEERSLDARVEALSVPTLIVFGERDRLTDPSDARDYAATPRIDKATIAAAGHSSHVERPAETADLIRRFASGN